MGSWGIGNFENDDAMDWLHDLKKSKGLHVLVFPIDIINSGVEYHEAPDCCEALAASEIIAASITGDITVIPEEARIWLKKRRGIRRKKPEITIDHVLLAKEAIERIVYDSELKDMMDEAGELENWIRMQSYLFARLDNVQ